MVQCSNQLSYEVTQLRAGQFIKASTGFEPMTSAIRPVRDTMCGFTAQLVEHRTGMGEVTGSNPLEALIFSGFIYNCIFHNIYILFLKSCSSCI